MRKNHILRKNYERIQNDNFHKLNEPNFVEFSSKISSIQGEILVEVEEDVNALQPLIRYGNNLEVKSTVFGKIKTIEERQNKDESFSLSVNVENKFQKVSLLKKLVKPTKDELLTRIKDANIVELFDKTNSNLFCINLNDTKFTLGLNAMILKTFLSQILKGAGLIKKAFEQEKVYILTKKQNRENIVKQIEKYNLKGLEVIVKTPKNACILDPQTALDFYEAVSSGIIRTERIIALSGESLLNSGYYLVKLGTPLRELIALCGGFKHTYEEVENFKEDAQMAVFDQIQIKKEIKQEKDKEKKLQLKTLLKEKKEEAQKFIFDYFKLNQQKFALCLADMIFLENEKWLQAKSLSNPVEHTTRAILFLSNHEQKNKFSK